MLRVIPTGTLPLGDVDREFAGEDHGVPGVSFLVVEAPPGRGPRLHRHGYDEILIVHQGTARVTAGDETVEISDGDALVIPAGTPHSFVNTGASTLRQIDIHVSPRFITDWLE